jgi:putative ABC transport system substrate-binding protein
MRASQLLRLLAVLIPLWAVGPVAAQEPRTAERIAVLLSAFPTQSPEVQQLREGLRDLGYIEGRDVVLTWRSAEGDYDRLPSIIAEVMAERPAVIVVEGTIAARGLKQTNQYIPIVMAVVGDPLASGLIDSLAKPGGAITGLSMVQTEIVAKRLQLLKEAIPRLKRVGVLWDAAIPWHEAGVNTLVDAGTKLRVQITPVRFAEADRFTWEFEEFRRARVEALYILDSGRLGQRSQELLRMAASARLPAMIPRRDLAKQQGALLSYSADFAEMFRRSAQYVDRILKGARPGELPVEQATKFDLAINLRTASSLGLRIPQSLLDRADEVYR